MRGLERRVRNRKIYDQWMGGKTAKELMTIYSLSKSSIYRAIAETKELVRPSFFTDRDKVREIFPAQTEEQKSVFESFNATMKKFFTLLGR